MRRFIPVCLLAAVISCWNPSPAPAASEAECAIWLCLPSGFPSGCSAAYSAFRHRIKKKMSPLPALSSCTTGPNGVGMDGRYELGYEAFETCKIGYVLKQQQGRYSTPRMCFPNDCTPGTYSSQRGLCDGYAATPRAQPNYIKIWAKGEYLGQYWY